MPKNTVLSPSPRFVVRKAIILDEYMRLEYVKELKINWTNDKKLASPYTSKYAAKNHLRNLRQNFEIPDTIIVEQM